MDMFGKVLNQLSGRDEKIQTLKSNIETLASLKNDINAKVEDEELRTGKKRKHVVEDWLRNVERMKNKVQDLGQEARERKFSSLFPGNRVDKLNEEIAELGEQGSNFQGELVLDVCEARGEPLLPTKLTGQAVHENMEEILALLMDGSENLRIGIYGMGGVGKTSVAVNIHNKLRESSKTCDHVFWCTVSKDHDYSIGKLQSDIAKCLEFDLSKENNEKKRAAKLSEAFARRGKCVLFLDDVWDKIDLHRVGIPDECKLILTTRSFDVCRKIGCQGFKVEPLSKEEAWNLFWEKLCNGEGMGLSPKVIDIAKSVAAKCGGLPLGIVTMAGSMRGVGDICEWRNVLEELKKPTMEHEDMEKDVLPILKLSYSRLNYRKLQLCFLYCAMYPEDYMLRRSELIRHFIAEGLLDETNSLQAKFDEGHTKLNKLERSCLLESAKDYGGGRNVKMHDLIRDMALKITKESHPRFMVKAGLGLTEIPGEQEWSEDLDKVSLMDNDIEEIPQGRSPKCPRLLTLILKYNPLCRIADSFFEHMHALQLLDLSNTNIEKLPNSISNLKNLTALLLGGCWNLTYVPPLGNLTVLRELDLSGTAIPKVPEGVDKLVNLNILNMEKTCDLKIIPNGTLGRLSRLQHVKLHCKSGHIAVQVEELEGMTELEGIAVQLGNVDGFNQFAQVLDRCGPRLNKYALSLCLTFSRFSGLNFLLDRYDYNKLMKLHGFKKGGGGKYGILIPHEIEVLQIHECSFASSSNLCDVFPTLYSNSRHLKVFRIAECSGIKCILPSCCFSSSSSSTSSSHNEEREAANEEDQLGENRNVPFRSLEILEIINLPDLWALFWPNMLGLRFEVLSRPHGTFSSLKELYISNCTKIKCMFVGGVLLRHLQNLENIMIYECDQMMEIIDDGEGMTSIYFKNNDGNSHNSTTTLPKLKNLILYYLPALRSICEGKLVCDSIEIIEVKYCPKLKRLPFSLPLVNGQPSAPKALKEINIENIDWWESLEWEHPSAKDVLVPFVHFQRELIWQDKLSHDEKFGGHWYTNI